MRKRTLAAAALGAAVAAGGLRAQETGPVPLTLQRAVSVAA